VDVKFGAVHAAPTDDELVHAGVADHHAGHVVGCVGAFEVAPGTAEAAGVLVDVEQQHQIAAELVADDGSRAAMWQKIAAPDLDSALPRP
jgi:hypothetical protein